MQDLVNHGALRVINLEKGKVTKDVAKENMKRIRRSPYQQWQPFW